MPLGKLYLIPTPIGETQVYDVLPEANRAIINSLSYFIVENTRSARRFLSKAKVERPIDSLSFVELNEHTPPEEVEGMLAPLLRGESIGVLSEAGVPGVADPGADAVAIAHRLGVQVCPLVGPSSILLALMASGLNGQSFAFNGYLPIKSPERGKAIRHFEKRAKTEHQSQLFIEAPYRNVKLFEELVATCHGDTLLSVATDILEPNQLIRTLTIGQWKKAGVPDIHKRPTIFTLG